jgi:uncharacterized protein YbcV (DUF1398 family)
MDEHVKDVVRAMTRASDEERIAFPDVVANLAAAGIERYYADLVCSTKTYYTPEGSFEVTPCHVAPAPAEAFSAEGVNAAVRASQSGAIRYGEFCARIAAAGCVGYVVTLAGKRAVYYGRTGDSHTEWFPGTKA